MKNEYPVDYFIEIEGDNYRVGRLSLNSIGSSFTVEIDIVQKETKKIWTHVDILYGKSDKDEALEDGVQRLSNFLQGK